MRLIDADALPIHKAYIVDEDPEFFCSRGEKRDNKDFKEKYEEVLK